MTEPQRGDRDAFVAGRLSAGETKRSVVEALVSEGLTASEAWNVVRRVDETLPHTVERAWLGMEGTHTYDGLERSHNKRFIAGAMSLGVGLGITACTYATAGPGEAYFVILAPVMWGAYQMVAALISIALRR